MRLWIFDFDGTISDVAPDRTSTKLDSAYDALLRRLADDPSDQVAIVSKKNIFDIAEHIDIPGVIIGGFDGIEWQLPSGYRIGPFREYEDDLIRCRLKILPEMGNIVSDHRIEIDDKLWSITVDTSQIKYNDWIAFEKKICSWSMKHGLTASSGLDRIDIQLIPGFNRSVGISYLARLLNLDSTTDSIVYAGDNESDVTALWWTLLYGGTAIMVGNDLHVPGADYVKDSAALIALIDSMMEVP